MSPWHAFVAGVLALALASGATASPVADAGDPPPTGAAPTLVDLNHASVEALCTLPGIGRKKAEAIIALRDRRPFTRVTQLLQIKGIGRKTLLKLKPRITVTPPTTATATATAATATAPSPPPSLPRTAADRHTSRPCSRPRPEPLRRASHLGPPVVSLGMNPPPQRRYLMQ